MNKLYIQFVDLRYNDAILTQTILFIADRGTVQKVIVLPKDTASTEQLTLEEVEVFRVIPIECFSNSVPLSTNS